jgi:hypothetical protein
MTLRHSLRRGRIEEGVLNFAGIVVLADHPHLNLPPSEETVSQFLGASQGERISN